MKRKMENGRRKIEKTITDDGSRMSDEKL